MARTASAKVTTGNMFGTFVAFEDNTPAPRSRTRKNTVARACVTCQRRKIKCDGSQLCYNCKVSKVQCIYTERRRRGTQRRGSGTLQEHQALFNRLFGQISIKPLLDLSREEILRRLEDAGPYGAASYTSPSTPEYKTFIGSSPTGSAAFSDPAHPTTISEAAHGLEALQERPAEGFGFDESSDEFQEAFTDDVNGLSLAVNRKGSFFGISSIPAAVKVLVKALPSPLIYTQDINTPATHSNDQNWFIPELPKPNSSPLTIPLHEGQQLIDAYFLHIHVFAPMLHEETFRTTYLSNTRQDSPWLALLNMVFAMGSIASSTSDSNRDIAFYQASREHMGLESLGTGRMETLQALILMGGMYLNYRNRPNLASALLGAAHRIACSLGLHKEFPGTGDDSVRSMEKELNRRTWWSLYVLDSWGCTILGRPVAGEEERVQLPNDMVNDHTEASLSTSASASPFHHLITFSRVIARIHAQLRTYPIPPPALLGHLDSLLTSWHASIPCFMQPPHHCAEEFSSILTWRYQNMRMLLHRPIVLSTTSQNLPIAALSPDDQNAVQKCRDLAEESILSIRSEIRPTNISGWQGVWFLFQAVLVPLMALAVESEEHPSHARWCELVLMSVDLCDKMGSWSLVGAKTKDIIMKLYQGTKRSGLHLQSLDVPKVLDIPNPLEAAGYLVMMSNLQSTPIADVPNVWAGLGDLDMGFAPISGDVGANRVREQPGYLPDSGFWSDVMGGDDYFGGWEDAPPYIGRIDGGDPYQLSSVG